MQPLWLLFHWILIYEEACMSVMIQLQISNLCLHCKMNKDLSGCIKELLLRKIIMFSRATWTIEWEISLCSPATLLRFSIMNKSISHSPSIPLKDRSWRIKLHSITKQTANSSSWTSCWLIHLCFFLEC